MKLRFLVIPLAEDPQPEILSIKWRSARDSVGIVAIRSGADMKHWKAHIGVSKSMDENADARHIANYGAKLDKAEACAFFPELDPDLFIH